MAELPTVLLPLVLAGVLSVVAVAAAGPRPAWLPGRRAAGVGVVAAVVVGLAALGGQGAPHPGGDPGGRILAALRPAAAAVPAGALVLSRQEREPGWTACGGGRSGWSQVGVDVQFSVPLAGDRVAGVVAGELAELGWRASGSGWTRPVPGGAVALAALSQGDRADVWWLRVSAPPEGPACPR